MRVSLDHALFSDDYESFLVEIVGAARRRRHRVTTKGWGVPEAERPIRSWLGRRNPSTAAIVVTSLDQGVTPPPWCARGTELTLVVLPDTEPEWPTSRDRPVRLPPGDVAVELVGARVKVWFEHAVNDAAFLCAGAVPEWDDLLQHAFDPEKGWCEPTHGGGLPALTQILEQQIVLHPRHRLRSFVLCDSDSPHPEMPADAPRDVGEVCQKYHIPHHLTERRAIENYVPLPALERWANTPERRAWLEGWRRLTPLQRHHVKLKKGKDGGLQRHGHHRQEVQAAVEKLYGSLLADLHHPVSKGPPGDIASLWSERRIEPREIAYDDGLEERVRIYRKLFQAL